MLKDLKAKGLNEVKKNPSGQLLEPKYLLELLNFVAIDARKRRETERNAALERRLEFFKNKQDAEYRQLVAEEFKKDDEMCEVVLKEILALIDTDQKTFEVTLQVMSQNP